MATGKQTELDAGLLAEARRRGRMEIRTQDAQVRIVPFGTVHLSALIAAPQQGTPEKQDEQRPIKPIQGTTAQTRIVSSPRPSPVR